MEVLEIKKYDFWMKILFVVINSKLVTSEENIIELTDSNRHN